NEGCQQANANHPHSTRQRRSMRHLHDTAERDADVLRGNARGEINPQTNKKTGREAGLFAFSLGCVARRRACLREFRFWYGLRMRLWVSLPRKEPTESKSHDRP